MLSKKPKKITYSHGVPLTVFLVGQKVCMLSRLDKKVGSELTLSWSRDGFDFQPDTVKVHIFISEKKKEKIKDCRNFSISSSPTAFVMTYIRDEKKSPKLVVAKSKDLSEWTVKSEMEAGDSERSVIVYDKTLDMFEMYRDGLFVKNQSTRTLISWKNESLLLFTTRDGSFDREKITVLGSIQTKEGLLLLYDASFPGKNSQLLQVGAILFDQTNTKRIVWRSEVPIWQGVAELKKKTDFLSPIGSIYHNGIFAVYWVSKAGLMVVASFPAKLREPEIPQYKIFHKFEQNPILEPRSHLKWEGLGTFNPGVFQDEDNVLHMFYRALGEDGISRVGYAQSEDGLHFTKRLPYPVFEPHLGFGMPNKKGTGPFEYNPMFYHSGGGWGGSEDPRVVRIEDNLYMTYVAFEGWQSVRMAITSISIDDFKHGRWNWRKPVLISPPGEVNKNWVLFPEKINGKFAILHSIAPDIMIDYFDDPKSFDEGKYFESKSPSGIREGKWDYKVRGAGTPPLKTPEGWLILYHATEKKEPNKYKLGAMLLDLKDPSKVLHRSSHAILYPDMWYENEGKPGVVYASGATVRDKDLYIYYGGGDRVVCAAKTNLKKLLDYLVSGKPKEYQLQSGGVNI